WVNVKVFNLYGNISGITSRTDLNELKMVFESSLYEFSFRRYRLRKIPFIIRIVQLFVVTVVVVVEGPRQWVNVKVFSLYGNISGTTSRTDLNEVSF
ncbi:hypothetical protein V1477_003145, partial [Vespula maculifrons]